MFTYSKASNRSATISLCLSVISYYLGFMKPLYCYFPATSEKLVAIEFVTTDNYLWFTTDMGQIVPMPKALGTRKSKLILEFHSCSHVYFTYADKLIDNSIGLVLRLVRERKFCCYRCKFTYIYITK